MRDLFTRFLQFAAKQGGRIWLYYDLCLKIRTRAISDIFVILACETVGATVDAAPIAVDRKAPTTFPIGSEGLCNYFFCRRFLKDLELCRWRLADVFSRVPVIRIRRILDVSHRCNDIASGGGARKRNSGVYSTNERCIRRSIWGSLPS